MSELVTVDRPEKELSLLCARTRRSIEVDARISTLVREGLDWDYLLRLAQYHGTLPLLFWHLDALCSESVPESAMGRLREYFYRNCSRNLFLTGELLRILAEFGAHDVPAVPYKGPALAAFAYRNLALRRFGDLDLLVHKGDIPKAKELLLALGYRPEDRLTPVEESAFLESQREYVFSHNENGSVVELHWAVMPRIYSFPLDPEHLWENLGKVSLGGRAVSTFSPEDSLLFLCVHGSKHFWYRLGWICDVAELIWVCKDVDWERLIERTGSLGSRRMLFLGLVLASELLSAPVPERVLQAARGDSQVSILVRQVQYWLFQQVDAEPEILARGWLSESGFHPFRVRMRERLRDKIRYCLYTVLVPTLEDWTAVSLPKTLFPLYYLLRPIRLTGRYGRRLLGLCL